jgi:hypothetical protein
MTKWDAYVLIGGAPGARPGAALNMVVLTEISAEPGL